MDIKLTPNDLIAFEEEMAKLFGEKKIRAPIHLDNGNENQLIWVFKKHVNEDDWVLGSWRQHYKCLLKGVPPEELKHAILEGKSIGLCFPEYRIISSAIVGGALPIAVGIAMGIKRSGGINKVVCFLGEMTAETGIFHECHKYSQNFKLPILWVIEDNNKSVCTNTRETWNAFDDKLTYEPFEHSFEGQVVAAREVAQVEERVLYYKYDSKYPHAGGGQRIQF